MLCVLLLRSDLGLQPPSPQNIVISEGIPHVYTALCNYLRVHNLHVLQVFKASEDWTTFWSLYYIPWPMIWQRCQSSLGKCL